MTSKLRQPAILSLFVSFLAVFFVAVFFISSQVFEPLPPLPKEPLPPPRVSFAPVSIPDPFTSLFLEAKAAYVLDARTGKVLFAKSEEAQLPLASLTKVMTALVSSNISEGTDVARLEGERWSVKELLDYTLVVSSNNGASALAGAGTLALSGTKGEEATPLSPDEAFVQKMNEKARALSLAQTFYLNPNGLDVNKTLSGAYGSAKDMATLFQYILQNKPTLLEATTYDSLEFHSLDGVAHTAANTNVIAKEIPGLLASKTGFTDLAGGNLAIAFNVGPAHPVVAVVLGSSQSGRFTDMEQLVSASIKKIGQGG